MKVRKLLQVTTIILVAAMVFQKILRACLWAGHYSRLPILLIVFILWCQFLAAPPAVAAEKSIRYVQSEFQTLLSQRSGSFFGALKPSRMVSNANFVVYYLPSPDFSEIKDGEGKSYIAAAAKKLLPRF